MFLTDGFATVGPEISGCDDVILTVGARNESRVLILMSALPVNYGTTAKRMMIWRPRGSGIGSSKARDQSATVQQVRDRRACRIEARAKTNPVVLRHQFLACGVPGNQAQLLVDERADAVQ